GMNGVEAGDLAMRARIGLDQGDFAGFGSNQKQVLIGQEHHLSGAVAARSPSFFAVFEPHASKETCAETVKMAIVHHQIVEIRADRTARPYLLCLPARFLFADPQAPCAVAERRS